MATMEMFRSWLGAPEQCEAELFSMPPKGA